MIAAIGMEWSSVTINSRGTTRYILGIIRDGAAALIDSWCVMILRAPECTPPEEVFELRAPLFGFASLHHATPIHRMIIALAIVISVMIIIAIMLLIIIIHGMIMMIIMISSSSSSMISIANVVMGSIIIISIIAGFVYCLFF